MNMYIGNLSYNVRESDLRQVMEDDAAAAKAIAELDGAEFFGHQMVVKEAGPPKY